MSRVALSEMDPGTLAKVIAGWGHPGSHAGRVLRNYYRHGEIAEPTTGATSSRAAARLWPAGFAERISSEFPLSSSEIVSRQASSDGTVKLLLRLQDGRAVESVLMSDFRDDRAAGCLSTQVGCAMGCDFCATARGGFERNLTAGEMVEQFVALRREASGLGRALQTIVFMGMGEPLLNLDALLVAIRRIADNEMGGLGWRRVTISTVGVVPGIDELTRSGLGVNLAVSLHAPDDATRARLLPPGKRYRIEDILEATDRFQAARGRPVTIQYCLLAGVNDAVEQAAELARRLGGRRLHVNLLRYNATGAGLSGALYSPTDDATAGAFAAELSRHGVVSHFRRPRGREIDAACGQLRASVRVRDRTPSASAGGPGPGA